MPVQVRPQPPTCDEVEALIEEASRRARRRRVGYAAVLVTLVALAGTLYALLGNGGGRGSPAHEQAPGPGRSQTAGTKPCGPAQVRLVMGATQGTTGALVDGVAAKLRNGPACVLSGTLRYAVRRADGSPVRQIDGNPAEFAVRSVIRSGAVQAITPIWGWSNWCHGGGRFQFSATLGSMKASVPVSPTSCEGRPGSSQSGLGVLPGSRAVVRHDQSGR